MVSQPSLWMQLKSLLWRNYLLKRRNKGQLVQEIIMPIFYLGMMIMMKSLSKPKTQPAISSFPAHSLNNLFNPNSWKVILASPDTLTFRSVMAEVTPSLGNPTVEYFATQEAALERYQNRSNDVSAGVFFNNQPGNKYSYTLRFPYDSIPKKSDLIAEAGKCRQADGLQGYDCLANQYLFSGFLALQTAVDSALMKVFDNVSSAAPTVEVELMPMPEKTPFILALLTVSSIYFVLGFSTFINYLAVNLVAEKEKKIREGMKMMGLRDVVFWLSWAIIYAVIIVFVAVIMVLMCYATSFMSNSNQFLLFLILVLYGLSIISLAFLFTPFFNKARTAGAIASLSSIVFSLLYMLVNYVDVPAAAQWAMCLLSPVAVAIAINKGVTLDILHGGMTFETLTLEEKGLPLYPALVMLAVDTVLYLLLAIYLDHVIPGEYGVRYKPWYFLQRSYWMSAPQETYIKLQTSAAQASPQQDVEPVPPELADKKALRIINISKSFKNEAKKNVFAVNDLSLDIYEGQITALLGHNGAGKTTLINMLTGVLPPTSGTATIYGKDITVPRNMERLRFMFGICPQHNILYEDLTCEEHLQVFAGIKGVPSDKIQAEVQKALKDTDISKQAKLMVKELSGGQKRKLSVAMALIGNPKIIFLDEPTAGMDPFSRRHLWSLLKKSKEGRIIMLSTHFMDEADILADRKAIISKGKLRCFGSSLFLKNRFGIGYHLNMVVEEGCQRDQVTDLVKGHIPFSEQRRPHGNELAYILPTKELPQFPGLAMTEAGHFDAQHAHLNFDFAALFGDLETSSLSLGVQSYGVAMTTLEEVFLKLGEEAESEMEGGFENKTLDKEQDHEVHVSISEDNVQGMPAIATVSEKEKLSMCFFALIKIRLLLMGREARSWFLQIIFPVILVTASLLINKFTTSSASSSTPEPLLITPRYYTQMQGSSGTGPPALASYDFAGNADSAAVVEKLNSSVVVDVLNSSVSLAQVMPHYLGIRLNDVTGIEINYTALYNDSAVHGLPALVNLMSTVHLALSNLSGYFNVTNLPWPSTTVSLQFNSNAMVSTMFLGFTFALIPVAFSTGIVQDRQKKIRSQLRASGVTFSTYWGSMFVLDLAVYFFPVILILIIALALQIESLTTPGAVLCLLLAAIFYLPSTLLFTYVASFLFDKYESAMAGLPNIMLWTNFPAVMVVTMLDGILPNSNAGTIVHYVCSAVFPPYAIAGVFYYIGKLYLVYTLTHFGSKPPVAEYFKASNNITISIFIPICHLILMFLLLRVLDVTSTGGSIREALWMGKGTRISSNPCTNIEGISNEDEDVKRERERVEALIGNNSQNVVAMVHNLRKEFNSGGKTCFKGGTEKTKVGVVNSTFAVGRGEVLGLLGPNGAGKSTTMNMIIAEEAPTSGEVMVAGNDVHSSLSKALQNMGYCPQHDALWDKITLLEHLHCYAAIKGVPKSYVDTVCNHLMTGLKIHEHANKHAVKASGGTKRKLSFAMSMLGNPQLVLLDEPSTGMDPQSKRFFWDTISSSFQNSERGAILTTHYMEEADALCHRIAIMVNGNIECLGSSQHLKDKFGSGYMLDIKLGTAAASDLESHMSSLKKHIRTLFPGAVCTEEFSERAHYKIPREDVTSLAKAFAAVEETKRDFHVEEYCFSQSTLEQVFLNFAKKQLEEGMDAMDMDRSESTML